MLTRYLSPAACAACRLCCNFHRASAWETPLLEESLARQLQGQGIPLHERPDGSLTIRLDFRAPDDADETADCPLLDPAAGCRLPRDQRPFECRIWPLRLMADPDGRLAIACYRACPGLRADARAALVQDATAGALRDQLLDYARRQPATVRPYDPHYDVLLSTEQPVPQGGASPC